MPQGLQLFNNAGTLVVDISDRLTRVLGVIFIGIGDSGSVTNDGFLTGSPWHQAQIYSGSYVIGYNPEIVFSGNQMFYSNYPSGTGAPFRIVYGVY